MKLSPAASYTLRRLALFAGTLVLCAAVLRGVDGFVVLAVAAVVSGVLSYFFLAGPREEMARSVAGRFRRLNQRLDAGGAREDAALDALEHRERRERARDE